MRTLTLLAAALCARSAVASLYSTANLDKCTQADVTTIDSTATQTCVGNGVSTAAPSAFASLGFAPGNLSFYLLELPTGLFDTNSNPWAYAAVNQALLTTVAVAVNDSVSYAISQSEATTSNYITTPCAAAVTVNPYQLLQDEFSDCGGNWKASYTTYFQAAVASTEIDASTGLPFNVLSGVIQLTVGYSLLTLTELLLAVVPACIPAACKDVALAVCNLPGDTSTKFLPDKLAGSFSANSEFAQDSAQLVYYAVQGAKNLTYVLSPPTSTTLNTVNPLLQQTYLQFYQTFVAGLGITGKNVTLNCASLESGYPPTGAAPSLAGSFFAVVALVAAVFVL